MHKIKFYLAVLLIMQARIAATAGVTITGETATTLKIKTAEQQTVDLVKHPRRVVICYGSFIGAWYAAGGTAVGTASVTSKATLPEAARQLPTVGSFGSPNPEQILALKPDLVLLCHKIGSHHQLQEILNANQIPSLMLEYENYRDFVELLDLFARLNGTAGDSSSKAAKLKTEVDAVIAGVPKTGGPRFLSLFFSAREMAVETSAAHTPHMAELLGGRNVTPRPLTPETLREKFNQERIMLSDPDLILVVTMGNSTQLAEKLKAEMITDENWKALRAIKNGRIYFLPNDLFLYKPNERFPEAFRMLREIMYGSGGGVK